MKRPEYLLRAIWLLLASFTICGCKPARIQPVDIVLSEDSCSVCRMAVSDLKFAAEAVAADGHVDYFDDLGCMIEFDRQEQNTGRALFVIDFKTQKWLEAGSAWYLWSRELNTPMSYGLAAFVDASAAEQLASQWPGRVMDWPALRAEWQP